jgi:ADP-ribosylglycohydrolase
MAVEMAAQSSRTTHGTQEAVDGCRLLAAYLVGALSDVSKEDLLAADGWIVEALPEARSTVAEDRSDCCWE